VRSAGPEKDGVDGIRRGLHADVSERDVHVVRAGRALDLIEYVAGQPFGGLELRAGGRTESQLELAGAGRRKISRQA
jgi:hypothetical protein